MSIRKGFPLSGVARAAIWVDPDRPRAETIDIVEENLESWSDALPATHDCVAILVALDDDGDDRLHPTGLETSGNQ